MAEPYILNWELSHLKDDSDDARLVKFPGWENIVRFARTREYYLPDKIVFNANLRSLDHIDFPKNDVNWPVMSKKMLEALIAIRPFPHRAIPLIMVDDVVAFGDRAEPQHSGTEDHNFFVVQLLEHASVMDKDQSAFEVDEDCPDDVEFITSLVLEEPQEGFPPLFRLAGYPVPLFVSSGAKLALEEAGIKGVEFESLATYF